MIDIQGLQLSIRQVIIPSLISYSVEIDRRAIIMTNRMQIFNRQKTLSDCNQINLTSLMGSIYVESA